MKILAIETSCDETAIAIVDGEFGPGKTIRVLANTVHSQIAIHKEYGGVFPMLAKREHGRKLVPLLVETLKKAGMYRTTSRHVIEHPLRPEFQEIFEREQELYAQFIGEIPSIDPPLFDAIAVTEGPGLEPALWTGINFARALSLVWKMPLVPINHMEGHLLAGMLEGDASELHFHDIGFPVIGLLVSGGHTEIVLMHDFGQYEIVGETKDDAVGEAFDKVARILGLPYPGGPEIARLALLGKTGKYTLPRPMLNSPDLDLSFSGLKTAVLYLVKNHGALDEQTRADIAREFEESCVEVLVKKTVKAVEHYGARSVVVGGGVSANKRLREALARAIETACDGVSLCVPAAQLTTDNALMIATAALGKDMLRDTSKGSLSAKGNLRIGSKTLFER